jgi:hypothetical protein
MITIGPLIRIPAATAIQKIRTMRVGWRPMPRDSQTRASAPMAATQQAKSIASVLASRASTMRITDAPMKAAARNASRRPAKASATQ